MNTEYWIDTLKLEPHPEGGYYKEVYRSDENISEHALPKRFGGNRSFSTSIYFLLRSEDRSLFHKIKSDELWHFYAGSSLTIYILKENTLITKVLGSPERSNGELQVVVPANCWFAAKVNEPGSFVLAGCTVSPGFDFRDFEMAKRSTLLSDYPAHRNIVEALTVNE